MASLVRVADRLVEAAAALILLLLLAVINVGVVTRTFDDPVIWSDELARYLMVWLAFLGWMIALRRRNHIRITFLIDRLPPGARGLIEAAIQALVALFGVLLAWNGFSLIEAYWDIESITMPITSSVLYIFLPLMGAVIVFQAGVQIVEALARPSEIVVHEGAVE